MKKNIYVCLAWEKNVRKINSNFVAFLKNLNCRIRKIIPEFTLNYDRCEARDGRQHSVWSLMRSISVNQVSALLCNSDKKKKEKGTLAGK